MPCETLMEYYNLLDVWLVYHPTEKAFTWRQNTIVKQSRLDLFWVSSVLYWIYSVVNSLIMHGYKSDHSLISATIKLSNIIIS